MRFQTGTPGFNDVLRRFPEYRDEEKGKVGACLQMQLGFMSITTLAHLQKGRTFCLEKAFSIIPTTNL